MNWDVSRKCCTLVVALFVFAANYLVTGGPHKNTCPLTCLCVREDTRNDVTCIESHLTRMPTLPNDTHMARIQKNNISVLVDNTFRHLTKMDALRINLNNIHHISAGAFNGLSFLTVFSMNEPSVQALPNNVLAPMQNVRFLRLRLNLKAFPESNICQLRKLAVLKLDRNAFVRVTFGACFEKMLNLHSIALGGNRLVNFSARDLYHLRKSNISELDLRACGLSAIRKDLFKYTPHLKKLILSHNKLHNVDNGVFRNIPHVQELFIGQNLFHIIPVAIHDLRELQLLDLQENRDLRPTFERMFLNLTNLQLLNLNRVILPLINSTFFHNFVNTSLQNIHLQENRLRFIDKSAFLPLSNLQVVRIVRNPLNYSSIENVFMGLTNNNISQIFMNSLQLDRIDHNLFRSISNNTVSILQLCDNQIKSIGDGTFRDFQYLKQLDLGGNQIVTIAKHAFIGAIRLQRLSLTNNNIMTIQSANFIGVSRTLQALILDNNAIKNIGENDLRGYSNLSTLRISRNGIKNVALNAFHKLGNLRQLNLNDNKINNLHPDTFRYLVSLMSLRLDRNYITQWDKQLFSSLLSLRSLKLNSNGLFGRNAEILAFFAQKLTSLEQFSCIRCGISELNTMMFANTRRLKILSLSTNSIKTWDPRAFSHLRALEILSLSRNNIVSVSRLSFAHLVSLRQLDLSYNPFACTCKLVWFRHWVTTGAVFVLSIGDVKAYRCSTPYTLHDTSLMAFTLTENDCVSFEALAVSISVLVVFALLICTVSVVYRQRWYVKYYYYLLRSRHQKYTQMLYDNATRYEYDAFVAYSYNDTAWVCCTLAPELERDGAIKLCLHDRDWCGGPQISHNIVESIRRSRKTILVLTNAFARSEWCRFELSMSIVESCHNRRNSLILVLKEDIDRENLTPAFSHLLTTTTYLPWPGDDASKQSKFWKALKRSIKPPRQTVALNVITSANN